MRMRNFGDYLYCVMDEKGAKAPEIYITINVTKQCFSKILSGKTKSPKKLNVCLIALALRLNLAETAELLRQAGYGLSDFDEFDREVMNMIKKGYTRRDLFDFCNTWNNNEKPMFEEPMQKCVGF